MQGGQRVEARQAWLQQALADLGRQALAEPWPLTMEASTRRFLRVQTDAGPLMLMDAPPASENNGQFLAIAAWLQRHGLHPPAIHAADAAQGFMLLEDLGDHLFADAVSAADPNRRRELYQRAVATLVRIQVAGQADPPPGAPAYDRARLQRELGLFETEFLTRLLHLEAPAEIWTGTRTALIEASLEQPRSCVYLDYHSRNLLLLPDGELGLVDFQDMHIGPLCYDLVSLLRDCYLRWPEAEMMDLRQHYLAVAAAAGIAGIEDAEAFARGFDLCGVQRHLKALGIFARVALDRGQRHYLADMPRVMDHLAAVMPARPETAAMHAWMQDELRPRLAQRLGEGA